MVFPIDKIHPLSNSSFEFIYKHLFRFIYLIINFIILLLFEIFLKSKEADNVDHLKS